MSDVVISVENLSKRYLVGHQSARRERYTALRDVIGREVRNFARKTLDVVRGRQIVQGDEIEEFWALKNVSFDVRQGEVLGIIGRNGAGKSTLLKILSRITEPTEGRVRLRGRVASLLEVGTGFHPELTGRENIFLNGSILGMTRVDIRKRFDDIVAFAEVEKFLDTPVKRYSSGMYVRLAFAVAAHVDPGILLVDEVLGVGDNEFQKKCLGRMGAVAQEGRTIIFVSHDMGAIQALCGRGLVISHGRSVFSGTIEDAVADYAGRFQLKGDAVFEPTKGRPSIIAVRVDQDGLKNGNLIIDIEFVSPFPISPPVPGVVISTNLGVPVYGTNPRFHKNGYSARGLQSGVLRVEIEKLPLVSGNYRASVYLGDWHLDYDQKPDVVSFDFRPEAVLGVRPRPEAIGYVEWPATWRIL